MDSSIAPVILILALFFLLISRSTCDSYTCSNEFSKIKNRKNISFCKKLTTLGAEFGWNYYEHNETQIDILFGMPLRTEMEWLAWGVNPQERPQMVGTRAITGIRQPNDSWAIDTYHIKEENKRGCRLQPSAIDVKVTNKKIDYTDANDYITISATLFLPPHQYNISALNHVWQVGYYADGMEPMKHRTDLQNFDSAETINLRTRESVNAGEHRNHLRKVHGILNIVGWGTFLPIGVIIARYFRVHPKRLTWWFELHVCCQIVGYILGTIGWIIGLCLGNASKYYIFRTHRMYSIFIFTFTTLQMLALRLRPDKNDEYKKFWDMYHHFLGYSLLAVISVNIFNGIDILKSDQTWRWVYIGLLGIFATLTLAFEAYSWFKFLAGKQKKMATGDSQQLTNQQSHQSTNHS